MYASRETKVINWICLLSFFLVGLLHALSAFSLLPFSENHLIFCLFLIILILRMEQVSRRITHVQIRTYFLSADIIMIFWMWLKTLRDIMLPQGHPIARYIWYLHTFFIFSIVLLFFFSALYMGKSEDERISRKWNYLHVLLVLFSLIVMTNDSHELVFKFPLGLADWSDVYVHYGIFYFLEMGFILTLFLVSVIIVLVKCSLIEQGRFIWIPVITISLSVLYAVGYRHPGSQLAVLSLLYRPLEIGIFLFIAFIENLTIARLFPSNDSYTTFWSRSSLKIGLYDQRQKRLNFDYQGYQIHAADIKRALTESVHIDDDTLLKSFNIRGGISFWLKDISDLNQLNREKEAVMGLILEENEVIKAENDLREEALRVNQRERIYGRIAEEVKKELLGINDILNHLPDDEAAFRRAMKQAAILNVFIKRMSNLLLISHSSPVIAAADLHLCFRESNEYLELAGIKSYTAFSGKGSLPKDIAIGFYRLYQVMIEAFVPQLDAIMTDLVIEPETFFFKAQISSPQTLLDRTAILLAFPRTAPQVTLSFNKEEGLTLVEVRITAKRGRQGEHV